ncbi:MAG TPA: tetratricopeptide repeat protein [Pirellulales bacterium]|jgi:predicted TPR repeat methyltransferase|nr:tetratricopeptide repeat protein [Pirellulales bacterium]
MQLAEFHRQLDEVARQLATDPDAARRLLAETLAAAPSDSTALARAALLLHRSGRTEDALRWMEAALTMDPRAELQNDYGSLLLASGRLPAAMDAYQSAIRADAGYALAHVNLADALSSQHRHQEALGHYRRAVALSPRSSEGHFGIASALLNLGQSETALAACQTALELRPGDAATRHFLAVALTQNGQFVEARAAITSLLAERPDYAKGWHTLGNIEGELGTAAAALAAYRRALELDPQLEEARFDIAALGAASPPPTMPPEYLVRLFDTYAPNFDRELVEKLDYRVPENLLSLVRDHAAGMQPRWEILDLGCGTGLLGKQFRRLASRLVGVDLSPAMLRRAEISGQYDRLICGDVTAALTSQPDTYDLILAADLLIYVGELRPLFAACAQRLKAAGRLAVSIETVESAEPYVLRETRRYAHTLEYLQALAAANGLTLVEARATSLRRAPTGFVPGHLILLQVPS